MRAVYVDNYVLTLPILDILYRLRATLANGKLKDIKYSEGNDNIVVTCPVHAGGHESKAAASIYVGDDPKLPMGWFNCFVCGAKGSFVHFVAECFDWPEVQAKRWLIDNFGKLVEHRKILGEPIRLNKAKKIKTIDSSVLNNYQSWCPYLSKRGISRSTCNRFNVKYDPEHRQVVFPCYDISGNLVMLARRSIDSKIFYMDKDVEKPVYCLNYIIKNNITKALVCEGPFDCLSANEYGFPAIATLGAPSIEQIQKINSSGIKNLYIMFDNDEAGRKFTAFLKEHLDKSILTTEVKILNNKKDINDLTKDEFIAAIKNAEKNNKIRIKSLR